MKQLLKLYRMSLWEYVSTMKRYYANLIFWIVYAVVNAILMLLFIPLYSSALSEIGTNNILSFILIGATVLSISQNALYNASDTMDFMLWGGIINYIFVTPVSRYEYFAANSLAGATISFIIVSPIFVSAIAANIVHIGFLSLILGLLSMGVVLFSMLQFGLIFAMALLIFKRIEGLTGIITIIITFLSGSFIPLQVLPRSIDYIAMFIPSTSGLYLTRYYLAGSSLIFPVYLLWTILTIETIVFFVTTYLLFKIAERKAEKIGLGYI
ncbi:MAG: ABC transporter permease [Candidatus Parvarchaeum sp.]